MKQEIRTGDVDWPMWLAGARDLDRVRAALVREHAIRHVMAETGETRKVVTDLIGAAESMGQEAVLDLTEGKPTTLRDALERYTERLEAALAADPGSVGDVVAELGALLTYPWPKGDG